jgi:hypothetical protein
LPPSPRGLNGFSRPVGPTKPPRDLTPATGARTTRLLRPRPPFEKAARRAWYQSRRSFSEGGSAPFVLRARHRSRSNRPAITSARPTLPRPSHPALHVRDDRDTPLLRARDGMSCKFDLGVSRSDLFFARGLDRNSRRQVICPSGKVARHALPSCHAHTGIQYAAAARFRIDVSELGQIVAVKKAGMGASGYRQT